MENVKHDVDCTITLEDIANSFGTTVDDIKKNCMDMIDNIDLSYSIISGEERDKTILNVLKRIDTDKQIIGSQERQQIWDNGWKENLESFIDNNYDLCKLIPKFIRYDQPIRYNLQYIKPSNHKFELDYYSIFRQWLFKKNFHNFDTIYEFGCGTGFNLVALSQLYPEKRLYGLDFVHSSVNLVNKIAEHYGYNMTGHLFDMISPEPFNLIENSAMFTIGSIEQLAGKFDKFIKYILEQPISLCIHVEPIIELYDENNLIDYLAIKFQRKRGYTKGLLPYLQKLESNKIIDILKVKRLYFGNVVMEGYNYIIWRPN